MSEHTCGCGECTLHEGSGDWYSSRSMVESYCPSCGDRLERDGTVTKMVPRKALQWLAERCFSVNYRGQQELIRQALAAAQDDTKPDGPRE